MFGPVRQSADGGLARGGEQIVEDAESFLFRRRVEWECETCWIRCSSGRRGSGCCTGVIFPYATVEAEWSDKALEGYEMEEGVREMVYRENAFEGCFQDWEGDRVGV